MAEENRSLAGQTADALIAYIVDRGLEQGDRLPNEKELSGLLGVGRSTLREAVRMLSSRNILEARQGAGNRTRCCARRCGRCTFPTIGG